MTAPLPPTATTDRTIGIVLFDGVEELDAVGPWEVLAAWTQQHPDDGWSTVLLSRDGAPVTAAKGMLLGAQTSSPTRRRSTSSCTPAGRAPARC